MAVTVDRWRRYGKDRLYVNDAGVRLGWHDLITGTTVVEVPERAADVHAAVAGLIPQPRAAATAQPPPAEVAAAAPATTAVPAPDQEASGSLAKQRAGQLARQRANQEWEAAKQRSKVRAYAGRMLGARTDERAWRLGAQGEETVGRALERLPEGWHVLHSVPVGQRGADIDHLVIGPPGVFTINTKHHPDKRVSVYPNTVYIDGSSVPYLRNSRFEATRTARLLTAAVGWQVPVTPVLVFINTSRVTLAKGGPKDVLVFDRRLVKALTRRDVALGPEAVDAVWTVAQRPNLWCSLDWK